MLAKLDKEWAEAPITNLSPSQIRGEKARIHYHVGNEEWWIVEKCQKPGDCCFGITADANGVTLNYFGIDEILSAGAELDLYYTLC